MPSRGTELSTSLLTVYWCWLILMNNKILHTTLLVILPLLLYLPIRLLWWTTRKKFHFKQPVSQTETYIAACWHSELLMAPQIYFKFRSTTKTSAIIGHNFNGDLIKKLLSFFNILTIRGSNHQGATSVILASLRLLKNDTSILITPDGPHGPRYHMYNGVVALAIKSRVPVVTLNYVPQHYWQCKGWDQFIIPKPFSRIDFYIQKIDLHHKNLEEAKELLLDTMNKYRLS